MNSWCRPRTENPVPTFSAIDRQQQNEENDGVWNSAPWAAMAAECAWAAAARSALMRTGRRP